MNHAFIPKKVKQWRQQGVIIGFWLLPLSFTILPVPWKHLLENNIVLIITQPVQPATEQTKNRKNWPWQTYFTILYLIFLEKQTNNCKHKTTYQLMYDALFFLDPNWVCNNNKPFFLDPLKMLNCLKCTMYSGSMNYHFQVTGQLHLLSVIRYDHVTLRP